MGRRKGSELGLAQLKELVDKQESRIDGLSTKRSKLQAEIDAVDSELASAKGSLAPAAAAGKKPRKVRRRKRPINVKKLPVIILELLKNNPGGLTLDDLAVKAKEAGYKTKAKKFKNNVYQFVFKAPSVTRDKKSGKYTVKAAKGKS